MDLRDGPARTRRACYEASSVARAGWVSSRCRTRTCTRTRSPRGCVVVVVLLLLLWSSPPPSRRAARARPEKGELAHAAVSDDAPRHRARRIAHTRSTRKTQGRARARRERRTEVQAEI